MAKKTIVGIVVGIVCSLLLTSCGTSQDPVAYSNQMVTIVNSTQKDMEDMNTAMTAGDYVKAESVQKTMVTNLSKSEKDVTTLGDFNNDPTFKNAVLETIKIYQEVATKDYPTLIKIRKEQTKDNDNSKEEEKVLDSINTKLEKAGNSLNSAIENFQKSITQ